MPCLTQGLTVQRASFPVPDFFGGADFALGELVAEFEKRFAGFRIVFDFAQRGETLDGRFQGLTCGESIKDMQISQNSEVRLVRSQKSIPLRGAIRSGGAVSLLQF